MEYRKHPALLADAPYHLIQALSLTLANARAKLPRSWPRQPHQVILEVTAGVISIEPETLNQALMVAALWPGQRDSVNGQFEQPMATTKLLCPYRNAIKLR